MNFTEHMNGRIEHRILDADERLRSHKAINICFMQGDGAGLEDWAWRDPSLLFEPIPRDNYHYVLSSALVPEREWQRYGCWLAKAAKEHGATPPKQDYAEVRKNALAFGANGTANKLVDYAAVVKIALEAGAHPDDKTLFGRDVLLDNFRWRNQPNLLRLALKHGAAPDMPPAFEGEGRRSIIRNVLVELNSHIGTSSERTRAYVEGLIESANVLLDAGAEIIDLAGENARHPFQSGISLVSAPWCESANPWVLGPMQDLVRRLHAHGSQVDVKAGYDTVPLVVLAIRSNNMALALQLIEMGAITDDEAIKRPEGPKVAEVLGLLDEAEKKGPLARACVLEAILRRRLAGTTPIPAALNAVEAEQTARRRMREI